MLLGQKRHLSHNRLPRWFHVHDSIGPLMRNAPRLILKKSMFYQTKQPKVFQQQKIRARLMIDPNQCGRSANITSSESIVSVVLNLFWSCAWTVWLPSSASFFRISLRELREIMIMDGSSEMGEVITLINRWILDPHSDPTEWSHGIRIIYRADHQNRYMYIRPPPLLVVWIVFQTLVFVLSPLIGPFSENRKDCHGSLILRKCILKEWLFK